jgi:small-conductance mechanosensitive channel
MDDPEPLAVFVGYGAGVLNFELRVWTMHIDRFVRIRTELALAIHHALEQAGIALAPTPAPAVAVAALPSKF